MVNALSNFGPLAAISHVQQQGELGRQRGQQNRLNMLAGQSYSATTPEAQSSLLGQMAQISPGAAQAQQEQFQSQEDRTRKELYGLAQGWKRVPSQSRQAYYEKFLSPRLSAIGFGEQPAFDEGAIDGAADQIIAAFGTQALGAGGNVQSTYVDGQGNRVAIMRDGSQRSLGPNNASIRVMEQEGALPYGVVTSGGLPGQIVNLGGAGAPAGVPVGGQAQPPGAYIDPSLPPEVQQQIRQSLAAGQEPPSSMTFAQGPVRTPTAAEKAAATESAKLNVQNSNFETEIDQQRRLAEQQARIDADKARTVEQAKSEQERASNERAKTAQLNNVDRGLGRIDSALKGLNGRFVNTGPIDGRIIGATPEGQELEAAVGAIQNDMMALTRVPGVGSQSDLEQKIANLKYPSIYNAPEVNARNVQQLKAFMSDLRQQIQRAPAAPAQGASSGPQPGTVEDGYRFRGGNPSDPNSWERI